MFHYFPSFFFQITPLHFSCALFDDTDGLIRSIISKAGGDTSTIERALKRQMLKLPSQDPAPMDIGLGSAAYKVLQEAQSHMKKQKVY